MKAWQKRLSAWLVALVMVLSLLPAAYAADAYAVSVTTDKTQVKVGETVAFTTEVTGNGTKLEALGDLDLWFWADTWGDGHAAGKKEIQLSDNLGKVLSNNITFNEAGTFYIAAELKSGTARLAITYVEITVTASEGGDTPDPGPADPEKHPNNPVTPANPLPTPVEAEISVPYVPGSEGDFIRGADVSSLLSILNSGARFKDWNGNSLGDSVDTQGKAFMNLLADAGVNWIRLRVWNDPFDANKKGYGGGNNDLAAAKTMGKWASDAGMKVLIDFHYSDFWADPGKQKAPKVWASYTVDQKASAITEFTTKSLNELLAAGVDVRMVQVGNETTNNICEVATTSADGCKLFDAGCDAVHAVAETHSTEILAAIHFTNPERSGNYANYAKVLHDNNVSYDVFASSYYPYWHGTTENLTSVLKNVADTYGKYVMVAETSWATSLDDGDGHDNTVREKNNDTPTYPFSVQGQATEVASVMRAVTDVGTLGIGAFYWEPAWIPVADVSHLEGEARTNRINANKALWEEYGSGWAASYAKEYDQDDAGQWYGGSAVDNQAVFDFTGKPLESLNVFKYVMTGAAAPATIETVASPTLEYETGDTLVLPETITVTNSAGISGELPVVWNGEETDAVRMDIPSTYTVTGTVSGTVGGVEATALPVTCTVVVKAQNLLSNPGFEEGNTGYTLSGWNGKGITNQETSNIHSGQWHTHFYNAAAFEAEIVHDSVTLPAGSYRFTLYAHGEKATGSIFVKTADGAELGTGELSFTGWQAWSTPAVDFTLEEETAVIAGASISVQAGGWGSLDDLHLGAYRSIVATPSANPGSGSFVGSQTVTLSCATEGATIYYTTDGSTPTANSTKYTETITLNETTTIKAIAVKNGMVDSAVLQVTYTKTSSDVPDSPDTPSNPDTPPNPGTPPTPTRPTQSVTTVTTGTTSATQTTAKPAASTKDGTSTASVSNSMGSEIVKQAVAGQSERVVIAPEVKGSVSKTEVTIPASVVGEIGSKTDADLTVSTPVADVTISNGGLNSLSQSGGAVKVTAEQTGSVVELSVTANGKTVGSIPGGVILTVPATDTNPGTVAVLVYEDGTREVVRKSVAGDGSVTIPLNGSAKVEITDNSKQFSDVPATNWEADAVAFASAHELLNGTSDSTFSPEQPLSRSMLAVVLHNLEDNPSQALTSSFNDVDNTKWYAEGVAWASEKGIITGYSKGQFGPDDNITREQLAVMLWRYAGSPATANNELNFADAGETSSWALEAMCWAAENGIINGKGNGILDPGGKATRAQAAQILKNFLENQ